VRKIQSKEYAELEKAVSRKRRRVGPSYGTRNPCRMPQGRYRLEMKVSVDPRHQAKLHEILREVLRELPGDRSVQAKIHIATGPSARLQRAAKADVETSMSGQGAAEREPPSPLWPPKRLGKRTKRTSERLTMR
jgi:hypothetical protein